MAVGIPNLYFQTLDDGNQMPGAMRLDTFETSWERRLANDTRMSVNMTIPFNDTANTPAVALSALTASTVASYTSFKIVVTIPDLSKSAIGTGVVSATIQGQLASSPGWVAVASQAATGASTSNTSGFQIEHQVSTAAYDEYRVQIITGSVTSQTITSATAYVDYVYVGNQRRRIINAIGSVETNHQSAFSDGAESLLLADTLLNPVFYTAPNSEAGDMVRRVLKGTYYIDRISIDRGEGRHATMLMSITREGDWIDE
jgi:hypothetical protein